MVYNAVMAKDVIRISEAEAATTNVATLLVHVRAGAEVVIENGARPVAVLRSAELHPGRLLSESIALAEAHGSTVTLDGDFGRDLEEIINSRHEPLNPPCMGLILDSSVVIAAERRGENVTQMLQQIVAATGDQRAVLSSIGLTELVHGIYRAQSAAALNRRDTFIRELLNVVEVYPYTRETALLAGKIDGEQQSRGSHRPLRRSANRSNRAGGWLLPADGQCAALPVDPKPYCCATLGALF